MEILKDIITSIVAVLWIYIAWQWLSTWKKQMHWKDEYTIAKWLLKSTYKFRDWVQRVRAPFMHISEFWEITDDMDKDKIDYYQKWWAYQKRFKLLDEAKSEIIELLLDWEVLWWNKIKDKYEKLFEKQHILTSNINWYLDSLLDRWYKDIYKDEIIYWIWNKWDKDDTFYNKLQEVIDEIDTFLKPFLK